MEVEGGGEVVVADKNRDGNGEVEDGGATADELSRLVQIVEENSLLHLTPAPILPQKSDWKISIL
eukprot:762800-Hanusia_phi.AAC.2